MGDNQSDLDRAQKTPVKPHAWKTEVDLIFVGLTAISFATRLWRLDMPNNVVFDEVHFGLFTSFYMNGIFHFDVHPPLGKLLLALMGYMAGYNGLFPFKNIGDEYPCGLPIWHLRLLPAVCGGLLCPIAYQIILTLDYSQVTACLVAFLFITENSLITQSRFILIDSMLLCSILFMFLSFLKFRKYQKRMFCPYWWLWLTALNISIVCVLSIKYSGVFAVLIVLSLLAYEVWCMLINKDIPWRSIFCAILVLCVFIAVLPCLFYCAIFYVHLAVLPNTGPHDNRMSSAFQASLKGGLSKITQGQPLEIAYGSQITLRHTHGVACWLHSHAHPYPVLYKDGRGSSAQQQVTCYSFKDVNNWWIVKKPDSNDVKVRKPPEPVKNGDLIQLIHGITGRALNSHDVAAPVSPQYMEVSCYVDYNISFKSQNLWKVELVNAYETNSTWRAIESQVRLVHVNTTQALTEKRTLQHMKFMLTGEQLPEWGFYQFEVATEPHKSRDISVWNVEEHRYFEGGEGDADAQNAPPDLWNPRPLGFWDKFLELQMKMLEANKDIMQEHQFSSDPFEWPTMERGVAYWASGESNVQVHFLGNFLTWISGLVAFVVYSLLFVIYVLRWRRKYEDLGEDEWDRFLLTGAMFGGGWFVNLIPYCLMERTLFLHHYLPALVCLILLLASVSELIYCHVLRSKILRNVFSSLVIVWCTSVFLVFFKFAPTTYGHTALTDDELSSLRWKETWGFIMYHQLPV